MAKIPEKLGSEYYRGFLSRQGQAFYDCLQAQLLRGDHSGKTALFISSPETAASDGFAAYKTLRDDHPEFFYLGSQSEFTRSGRIGTLKYPILYAPTSSAGSGSKCGRASAAWSGARLPCR